MLWYIIYLISLKVIYSVVLHLSFQNMTVNQRITTVLMRIQTAMKLFQKTINSAKAIALMDLHIADELVDFVQVS